MEQKAAAAAFEHHVLHGGVAQGLHMVAGQPPKR
jgi:hypothetical protein